MGNGQFGFYLVGPGFSNEVREGKPGRDYDRVLYKVSPGRFPSRADSVVVTASHANQSYSVTPPSYTKAAAGKSILPTPTGFGHRQYYSSTFPRRYDSKSSLLGSNSRGRLSAGITSGVSDFPRSRNLGESYLRHHDDFNLNYQGTYISPTEMISKASCSQGRPATAGTATAIASKYAFPTTSYNNNIQCLPLPEPPKRTDCGVPDTCYNIPPIRTRLENKFTKGCQTDPSPWILYENLNNGKFMAVTKNTPRPRECCASTSPCKPVDGSTNTSKCPPILGRVMCPNVTSSFNPILPECNVPDYKKLVENGTDPLPPPPPPPKNVIKNDPPKRKEKPKRKNKPTQIVKPNPPKVQTSKLQTPNSSKSPTPNSSKLPTPNSSKSPTPNTSKLPTPTPSTTSVKKRPKPKSNISVQEVPSVPPSKTWSNPWPSNTSLRSASPPKVMDEEPPPSPPSDITGTSAQTGNPDANLKRHPSNPGPPTDVPILMANRRSVHNLKRSLSQNGEDRNFKPRPESPKPKANRSAQEIVKPKTRLGGEMSIVIPSSLSLKKLMEGQVQTIPLKKTKLERLETQDELNVRLSKNVKVQKMNHDAKKTLTSAKIAVKASQSALKKKASKSTLPKESEGKAAGTERKRSIRFKDVPPTP